MNDEPHALLAVGGVNLCAHLKQSQAVRYACFTLETQVYNESEGKVQF